MFDWQAQSKASPIAIDRAEGIYFWGVDGKRYIDFNSQLMGVNIGHGDRRVTDAMHRQAERLAYISPFMAYEERALLGQKMAELLPGDIEKSFYTLGGAEANENAIKIARMVTGRHKIMARYRSYHGATTGAMTLTGDPRRWPNEPAMSGVVHVLDPYHGPQRPQDDAETALALPGRDDPARGARHDRRVLPGDRHRHERDPDPARRLPAGRARALHEVRHPHGERRGHVRVRPDRRVVRGEPLGRRARHHHVRQGAHVVLRAAGRVGHAAGGRRRTSRTTCSGAD